MLRLSRHLDLFGSVCSICRNYTSTLANKLDRMTETSEATQDSSQTEKRPLEDESNNEAKKQKTEEEAEATAFVRIKKKNYAMMLGYLGKDYYGMQRNPHMETIEEHLIKAMFKAKLINSGAFDTIQNIHFQRAARTDKGVSAVRQVVSLKLPENPCKDSINEHLPENIRVFSIKRVTKGFNCKSKCNARTYSYTMPTFAFASENVELFQKNGEFHDIDERMNQLSLIDGKPYLEYRLPKEKEEKVAELLKMYKGTKNFHNYTTKILPLDPRAKRYIMSFDVEKPFLVNDVEFITLKVKGQSFMMHQIRKMVSMIIGVMRDIVTMESFKQSFGKQKFIISRAPSLGLMLNIVHYDYYNERYGADGMHEKLDWADCEEDIKNFEKNYILKHVIDTEINEKSMLQWLAELNTASYGLWDETRMENKEDKEEGSFDD